MGRFPWSFPVLVTCWAGGARAFDLSHASDPDNDSKRNDVFEQHSCLQVQMLQTGQPAREIGCTASELEGLLKVVQSQSFRKNSCITADQWSAFADGSEDIDDIWEWAEVLQANSTVPGLGCRHVKLPTLLYLGLNHAGSCTISDLLDQVPGWSKGSMKEHLFWAREAVTYFGRSHYAPTRTLDQYRQQYLVGCDISQTFDASPFTWAIGNGKLRGPHAEEAFPFGPGRQSLRQIKHVLGPNTKLVFTIRDPVSWLSSMRMIGDQEAEAVICMADSIEGWLEEFPREQFLFLDFDHIFEDLPRTINAIVQFAGYPPLEPNKIPVHYSSGRRRNKRRIPRNYERNYHNRFQDCKQRLQNLTGLTFGWGL